MSRRPVVSLLAACAVLGGCASAVQGHGTLMGHGRSHVALDRIPVQRSDLPPGWIGNKPAPDDPGDAKFEEQLFRCVGGTSGGGFPVDSAEGPDFENGDAQISSSATEYATQAQVDHDIALITDPKFPSCMTATLRSVLKSQAPHGARIGAVDVSVTSGGPGGPGNVAATVACRITLSVSGVPVDVYLDLVFITGRRIEVDVDFFNIGRPIDPALARHLVTVVARRTANA